MSSQSLCSIKITTYVAGRTALFCPKVSTDKGDDKLWATPFTVTLIELHGSQIPFQIIMGSVPSHIQNIITNPNRTYKNCEGNWIISTEVLHLGVCQERFYHQNLRNHLLHPSQVLQIWLLCSYCLHCSFPWWFFNKEWLLLWKRSVIQPLSQSPQYP